MALKRQKIDIFGVKVDDVSRANAIEGILKLARSKRHGNYVVTVNSEFVMMARRDKKFRDILNGASLSLADGWWVAKLKLISGGKAQSRITGVDIVESVCQKIGNRTIRIGFLGGFGDVAKRVSKRQKMASPDLKVVLSEPGEITMSYILKLKKRIFQMGRIDILFVAYGMGRQEFWIEKARKILNVGVFVGVGGAFDYIAKVKKRAPKLMQERGLEWLWRLASQPSRVWRQRVLPVFFLLFLVKFLKVMFFDKIFKN